MLTTAGSLAAGLVGVRPTVYTAAAVVAALTVVVAPAGASVPGAGQSLA